MMQTIHFQLKDDIPRTEAAALTRREYENYKAGLERTGTKYRILSERTEADGSIVIEIIKQVNNYAVGRYMD